MMQFLRNAAARLTLTFLPSRRRWEMHMGRYFPVMKEAFPDSPCAHLLILRVLDDMESKHLDAAREKIRRLLRMVKATENEPDKALVQVLMGVFYLQCGDTVRMARCMRRAERHGHRFHLPHMLLAARYVYETGSYELACQELDKAIDCVYAFPPMDENRRRCVAVMHAIMSLAMLMMHRPEEAERLLAKAAPAENAEEYLHAQATLYALQGRDGEVEAALEALEKVSPRRLKDYGPGIRMMLDGTHPHFTAKTPDPEDIAAYWTWFVGEEQEMRRLLIREGTQACFTHQLAAFQPLAPEPAQIDMMTHGFILHDGQPEIHLYANHSRTYEALIDALLAACPPQVREHWTLRAFPGGEIGTTQENIAHYGDAAKMILREENPS
ncbi:MAG: hypothetical protein IJE07_06845 [Clostridia bacterium]|nr:hypothetical protein [Clostridia bacterium]